MSDFHVHVHHHGGDGCTETDRLLRAIHEQGEKIMANQTEAAAALDKLTDQMTKVGAESEASLKLIQELKDQAANENVSPALQQAIDRLAASIQKTDDLIPDVVPPTT